MKAQKNSHKATARWGWGAALFMLAAGFRVGEALRDIESSGFGNVNLVGTIG
tara:strand:- start:278 stop:433 length:156 start_codon:yes stop_codon:yes gene_type:complete